LPTIKNQLLIEEKPKIIFPTNQDKPEAWKTVREIWTDQTGYFCRFCVPLRAHPDYRKFYCFDNCFFYLDKKWEKRAYEYQQREKARAKIGKKQIKTQLC
jgi:hypothetical protein